MGEEVEKLKPCPFCGTVPALRDRPADKCESTNTGKIWSVTCYGGETNAHAWFYADTKDAVLAAWNGLAPAEESAVYPDREELGRLIYLALYEPQGAVWAANESKDVWFAAADRLRAALEQS